MLTACSLGLRPVHDQIKRRVDGDLFVIVLAYYFVALEPVGQ